MERIKEKESMDVAADVQAFDRMTKSFFLRYFINNFIDSALNVGIDQGRVLDIGTGNGIIPIKMYQKNSNLEICGVDLSEEMLAQARENLKLFGLEGKITFSLGDGKELPFEDNCFDLVTCNHLVHHLENPVPFFNEVARVLKEGAAVMMRDVSRPGNRLMLQYYKLMLRLVMEKRGAEMASESVSSAFTPKELNDYLKQSDLKGARVARYYLVPTILEVLVGIERVHKDRKNIKKLFPESVSLPWLNIPGKKYLH